MAKVRLSGFRELDRALAQLPKAAAKGVLRRVAKGALQPMADVAQSLAPVGEGDLKVSVAVSEKRTRRAKNKPRRRLVKGKWRSDPSTGLEMAMGPSAGRGALSYATFVEFGSVHNAPDPYMRPAWDGGANKALDHIKSELGKEIGKSAARAAKRAAKKAKS